MNKPLQKTIVTLNVDVLSPERKQLLHPLIEYIQHKTSLGKDIRLNFICTHNSRRSHLAQIWAQTMAFHFGVNRVNCYSGGTEATAMFPQVAETLINQGFQIQQLSHENNPIYAVKYSLNEPPIICFSKTFEDEFNPQSDFAAIMTCSSADEGCPFIVGAEKRFPIRYDDPKIYDGTDLMAAKYSERSIEIATEMCYVFSMITNG